MVMIQRVSVIGIVFAATLWVAVFTPAPPFNVKDAGGQILPACPVGYERNELGTCVPIVDPDPDGGSGDETAIEQEIG